MLNRVILMGRLTRDPEFRQTPSGIPMCRVSIAINRSYNNRQTGERVDETTFVDCVAWRSTAEFISRYFHKGNMILVEGSLRNDNYTDNNGVKHYRMNVVIDNASFCESKGNSGNQGGYQQGNFGEPQDDFGSLPGGYDSRQGNPYQQRQQGGYQQQGNYQQGSYQQQGGYQAPSAPAPQNSQPANDSLSVGNLSDFEEILSDGQLPF